MRANTIGKDGSKRLTLVILWKPLRALQFYFHLSLRRILRRSVYCYVFGSQKIGKTTKCMNLIGVVYICEQMLSQNLIMTLSPLENWMSMLTKAQCLKV